MFFVQAPTNVPTSRRRLPPRCSPLMIRAAPSRPVAPAVASRTIVSPPLPITPTSAPKPITTQTPTPTETESETHPAPTPSSSKDDPPVSEKAAPQVKVAAAAVRAAAASVATPSRSEGRPVGSSSSHRSRSVPKQRKAPYSRKNFQTDNVGSAYGRSARYVRDSIENDRPDPVNIAQIAAPDMIQRNRREFYFNDESEETAPLFSASYSASVAASSSSASTDVSSSQSYDHQATTTTTAAATATATATASAIATASVETLTSSNTVKSQAALTSADSQTSTQTKPKAQSQTASRPRARTRTRTKKPTRSAKRIEDVLRGPEEPDAFGMSEPERQEMAEMGIEPDLDSEVAATKPQRTIDDSIRTYLSEIGEVRLLDYDSEVILARNISSLLQLERLSAKIKRSKGSDPTMQEWAEAANLDLPTFRRTLRLGLRAKEHMVAANLRLVVSIAKKYTSRGLSFQDLIQEGSIGLIRGAEKFDANKGFKFSTYATWWIRQAITRAIADHSRPIRLPVHVNDTISAISKATKNLHNELGRAPTDPELASRMNIPVDKLQFIMRSSRSTISLETPMSKDGVRDGANLGSLIMWSGDSPAETAEKDLLREDLENLLNTLTPRERDVVRMRYGFDDGRSKTLEEIGNTFAVTRERIRQIESKALRKLRHPNRNAGLREYIYDSDL